MGFKDFFFVNDGNETPTEPVNGITQNENTVKFPPNSANNVTPAQTIPTTHAVYTVPVNSANPACAPHLDSIMELYESGFDGLNLPGYDFYEFFKAVIGVDANNPATYQMAVSMAKTMDPNINKETLTEQANYYITEINKVHESYASNGEAKRSSLLNEKESEVTRLKSEISKLDEEIQRIQSLKAANQTELLSIEDKFGPATSEIECKMMANDLAKDKIIGTITVVSNGILKYV